MERPSLQGRTLPSKWTILGSTEVAIVIGLNPCQNGNCLPASDILGHILYNGPYDPNYSQNALFKPPHQNFTVTIPPEVQPGLAQLAVFHVSLIGAGPAPFNEIQNITVDVQ
ncbi:hypothetical protein NLJ89_g7697 [Agrocybe chaxingu]|uniref:Uncharacterized protein n=1 Tax=Agrocybe chaxingu TaxID=84603 RepID=A0A9W8JU31_9AGAR|nr:hypothetical protein NLJ89_g7697 [Agrocybe chaxingu]